MSLKSFYLLSTQGPHISGESPDGDNSCSVSIQFGLNKGIRFYPICPYLKENIAALNSG